MRAWSNARSPRARTASSSTAPPASPRPLSVEERIRLVDVAVRTAKGRIPVVAATGSQSHADSIVLTEAAQDGGRRCGADRHALFRPPAAARPDRILRRSRQAHRPAGDDLSHPRPRRGQCHGRHGGGDRRAAAAAGRASSTPSTTSTSSPSCWCGWASSSASMSGSRICPSRCSRSAPPG